MRNLLRFLLGWSLCCAAAASASLPEASAANTLAGAANDAGTGVFLMRSGSGQPWVPAILLATDVDVLVSGPVARVTVRQSFFNQAGAGPGAAAESSAEASAGTFAEAFYVFPLPEDAAVHGMELTVGGRRIVGEIREKAEAARMYRQARREGQRAGLVEQLRPNLFTTSVANVGPGERIEVVLEYTQKLVPDGVHYTLRLPTTVTPRYLPQEGGPSGVDEALPPEAARWELQSPLRDGPRANRASVEVYVDAGHPLAEIDSASHDVHTTREGSGYRVYLAEQSVPMDRDYLLAWRIEGRSEARAAFFSEIVGGETYGLLLLSPPEITRARRLPREMVFVIDTSGSMGGASIRQARDALQEALGRLQPEDRFTVIRFASGFSTLFQRPVAADRTNLARASGFVSGLEAGGGTEMLPALEAALAMPRDPEYLRQIVFITDGAVGNEHGIFGLLHQRLGDARLFTVGIGSAPNGYFMKQAAALGRGSFTFVSRPEEVRERMAALFERLERPALRDIEIHLPDHVQAELWPARVPDLYLGEPVMVAMKLDRLPDSILVSGRQPSPWQQAVPIAGAGGHTGIATLWAREKIEALMGRIRRGAEEASVRPLVVDVALTHSLISRYTSFVAVDRTPARPADAALSRQAVPNLLPHGFEYPATGLGVGRLWWNGSLCLLVAFVVWLSIRRRRSASVQATHAR